MNILKFSTPTCVYCRVVEPSLIMYAKEQGATIQAVNAMEGIQSEEDRALCVKYDVMGVPVVVIQHDDPNTEDFVIHGFHDIMSFINEA